MKTFLHEVAEDLYARYGEGLSERAILFPSRRARLFFVDALTGIAGRPMWQAPVGDGRRSDDRDFGTPHRGPRAADHRTLQNLFGIPRRAVRQVLFLGRHAPDGFRHHRQIPDRRRDAVPQHLGDQGDRGRHFVPHSRAAANPAFLVDARRRNRSLGGEAPLPGDLEDPGAGLRPLPRTALRAGHRLQRHGPAGRRRPHPRRGVCLSRGAAICRGGIQRPVGVRETAIPLPLDGCRDRFLLGLRLLL